MYAVVILALSIVQGVFSNCSCSVIYSTQAVQPAIVQPSSLLFLFFFWQGVVGASDSCKSTLISAFHEGVVEMGEDDPRK